MIAVKPSKKIAVAFDMDLTLVNQAAGELSIKSFDYALAKVFDEKTDVKKEIDYSGKTDLGIMIELADKHNFLNEFKKNKDRFVDEMCGYFEKNIGDVQITPMPGALNLLEYFSGHTDVVLGIVTGNCERIAKAKLRKLGISDYFKFGGYGNMFEERADVVRYALLEAENYVKENYDVSKVDMYVFDDTPVGIEAVRLGKAKGIAVMSGKYMDDREFAPHGPVVILHSLEEMNRIKKIFPAVS